MKLFTWLLLLISNFVYAQSSEFSLRLDKAFLAAPSQRDDLVANLADDIQPFCDRVAKFTPDQLDKVKIEALESCHLRETVKGLDASETELGLKNGEPFMMRVLSGSFDEAAVWRYFIRTQKAKRLLGSLRTYFAQSAGINSGRVGTVGIPVLAASLDRYSYWTRVIAMKETMYCPPQGMGFCNQVAPQLASLVKQSWAAANGSGALPNLNDKQSHLLMLAKDLQTRLASLTLEELTQLENMDNQTSAGLGVPYFRQLLVHLKMNGEDVAPENQQKIQKAIMISQLRDALSKWNLNVEMVEVDSKAVSKLSGELQMVVNESGRIL